MFCPGSPRVSKLVAIAFSLFCVPGLLAAAERKEEATPPRALWIVVKEVAKDSRNASDWNRRADWKTARRLANMVRRLPLGAYPSEAYLEFLGNGR